MTYASATSDRKTNGPTLYQVFLVIVIVIAIAISAMFTF